MKTRLLTTVALIGAGFYGNAQDIVNTALENKNVILEEFTGKTCGYCPDGHKRAQEFSENNPGDVVLINVHCGNYASGTPNYNVMLGTDNYGDNLYRHSSVKLLGFPAGMVNRTNFPGYEQTSSSTPSNPGALSQSRGSWATTGATVLQEASPVNVGVKSLYDAIKGKLYVKVEVYYTVDEGSATNKINVGVLQNNIWGPQSGGSNYNPDNYDASRPAWSATNPNSGRYKHMHMLRHVLTGQWGETISNTASGELHTYTYIWDVPADINSIPVDPLELEVYAFVSAGEMGAISGTVVDVQTASGEVDEAALITQQKMNIMSTEDVEVENSEVMVYPNPATSNVFVKLQNGISENTMVKVYSSAGQEVEVAAPSVLGNNTLNIDISTLVDGYYFVEVSDESGVMSRKPVVKR